jgi:uncharacterized protein YukE
MNAFKRLAGLLVGLAILAIPLVAVWKFQAIEDWWRLRNYLPPAAIATFATEDTMTAPARHIFYVNHPKLISALDQFHQDCTQSEQAVVLGCYHPKQQGIAIFDVQDSRLHGVEEVTAAHEMLHAAYDRLSGEEKSRIDGLLQDYYQHDLRDQRIIAEINDYKQSEPNDVVNEMHSVFGTEASNLPPALENYYQRYFVDRGAVITFANGYEGEFTSRTNQIKTYDQQLSNLKQQIAGEEQALSDQQAKLQNDRTRLDSLRSSGRTEEYNAQVAVFNAEVDAYNRALGRLHSDIAAYNSLVERRNAVASELRSLTGALDTRLTTQAAK